MMHGIGNVNAEEPESWQAAWRVMVYEADTVILAVIWQTGTPH